MMPATKHLSCLAVWFGCLAVGRGNDLSGQAIYAEHCASCHGEKGQGVPDECEDPLHGTRALPSLAGYIDRKMPQDDPDVLNASESLRVAEYIMAAFYSPQARAKSEPLPKPAFARLTNRQFRESVADLVGSFAPAIPQGAATGLRANYFQSDGMNKKAKQVIEREDPRLDFDFGEGSPGEGISADQFSISWEGSLLTPATGWHEFRIRTPNGARFYLNEERMNQGESQRDDSGGKRMEAFIDAWVSSGEEVREAAGRVFLLGGRAYPLRFDYFKYKEKRGMVRLEWKQPRGEWQVLAAPYLSPAQAGHVTVVSTDFPADDASEGYERGTGISKAWIEATTAAALETANRVLARLPRLAKVQVDDPGRVEKLKAFLGEFAARAFRRPLDASLRAKYLDAVFEVGVDPEVSVKRGLILILQSPRFLYPELGSKADDFTVASRLSLGVWDSLPDPTLLTAARDGRLRTGEQVANQARRMMSDPRAKAKLAGFFQHWLKLDVEADMRKEPESFPGFDPALVADLRRSLELFVEQVVWSEASDYRELLQADHVLLNRRLAEFYGAPVPLDDGFHKVLLDGEPRAGVITHPYLLARLAHHHQTSPIHRGVFATRNLLGGLLKPPPEAIAFDNNRFDPKLTMREKVVQLTHNPSCMTCHETINPLGFSLENFDAVGRFRLTENGRPIVPGSDFETFEGRKIHLRGPRDLAKEAVESPTARRGFVRQLFQEVIKQNPGVYGTETLNRLENDFTASGYHLRDLFIRIQIVGALRGIQPPDPSNS